MSRPDQLNLNQPELHQPDLSLGRPGQVHEAVAATSPDWQPQDYESAPDSEGAFFEFPEAEQLPGVTGYYHAVGQTLAEVHAAGNEQLSHGQLQRLRNVYFRADADPSLGDEAEKQSLLRFIEKAHRSFHPQGGADGGPMFSHEYPGEVKTARTIIRAVATRPEVLDGFTGRLLQLQDPLLRYQLVVRTRTHFDDATINPNREAARDYHRLCNRLQEALSQKARQRRQMTSQQPAVTATTPEVPDAIPLGPVSPVSEPVAEVTQELTAVAANEAPQTPEVNGAIPKPIHELDLGREVSVIEALAQQSVRTKTITDLITRVAQLSPDLDRGSEMIVAQAIVQKFISSLREFAATPEVLETANQLGAALASGRTNHESVHVALQDYCQGQGNAYVLTSEYIPVKQAEPASTESLDETAVQQALRILMQPGVFEQGMEQMRLSGQRPEAGLPTVRRLEDTLNAMLAAGEIDDVKAAEGLAKHLEQFRDIYEPKVDPLNPRLELLSYEELAGLMNLGEATLLSAEELQDRFITFVSENPDVNGQPVTLEAIKAWFETIKERMDEGRKLLPGEEQRAEAELQRNVAKDIILRFESYLRIAVEADGTPVTPQVGAQQYLELTGAIYSDGPEGHCAKVVEELLELTHQISHQFAQDEAGDDQPPAESSSQDLAVPEKVLDIPDDARMDNVRFTLNLVIGNLCENPEKLEQVAYLLKARLHLFEPDDSAPSITPAHQMLIEDLIEILEQRASGQPGQASGYYSALSRLFAAGSDVMEKFERLPSMEQYVYETDRDAPLKLQMSTAYRLGGHSRPVAAAGVLARWLFDNSYSDAQLTAQLKELQQVAIEGHKAGQELANRGVPVNSKVWRHSLRKGASETGEQPAVSGLERSATR